MCMSCMVTYRLFNANVSVTWVGGGCGGGDGGGAAPAVVCGSGAIFLSPPRPTFVVSADVVVTVGVPFPSDHPSSCARCHQLFHHHRRETGVNDDRCMLWKIKKLSFALVLLVFRFFGWYFCWCKQAACVVSVVVGSRWCWCLLLLLFFCSYCTASSTSSLTSSWERCKPRRMHAVNKKSLVGSCIVIDVTGRFRWWFC